MYESLAVEKRELKGELTPSQLRRKGIIPAVIYGSDIGNIPIQVEERTLIKCLSKSGQVFEVQVQDGPKHLANVVEVERTPLGGKILHVAFHQLSQGKETHVDIPIELVGKAPGVKDGGIIVQSLKEIEVIGLPKDLPDSIQVDISGLQLHDLLHIKDMSFPAGIKIKEKDPERVVVSCAPPKAEKVTTPEPQAAGEAVAGAPAEADAAAAQGSEKKSEK